MGSYLAKAFGPSYVAVGFTFGEGGFQAEDGQSGPGAQRPRAYRLGPAPPYFFEQTLARANLDIFFLPLRDAEERGAVVDWLYLPHPIREYGAIYVGRDYPWSPVVLPRQFDGLFYIANVSRARPNDRNGRKLNQGG